ncbi:MAG: hypothetical protein AVDCRST_MAG79-272, partial [uncultured Thermoleophilia bacterium]
PERRGLRRNVAARVAARSAHPL